MILPLIIYAGCFLLIRRLVKIHSNELQNEEHNLQSQIVVLNYEVITAKQQQLHLLNVQLAQKIEEHKQRLTNLELALSNEEKKLQLAKVPLLLTNDSAGIKETEVLKDLQACINLQDLRALILNGVA